jgi:GNAT superfamily N-acetyltransferase
MDAYPAEESASIPHIHQAQSEEDRASVRELFWEYLQWANSRVNQEFGVNFDIRSMLENDMAQLHIFLPPDGRLLLASQGSRLAGLACMKRLKARTAEIKRMYVRPEFRRKGMGRRLVSTLIEEAKKAGYTSIRLDSARFMTGAHAVYKSAGFREIAPYPESEIPVQFQEHWIFMEKDL